MAKTQKRKSPTSSRRRVPRTAAAGSERFPYTTVPNSLRTFLRDIPKRSVPPKITQQYLQSIGLKSSNDRSILPVLKFVGLVDGAGVPTEAFKQFRDTTNGPASLAQAIKSAYKPVFETYEDAYKQADDALQNFFRANTSVGERSVQYIIATFKTLVEFANFEAVQPGGTSGTGTSTGGTGKDGTGTKTSRLPELHVTFQIHLPQSNDPAVYDSIFDAMSRSIRKLQ